MSVFINNKVFSRYLRIDFEDDATENALLETYLEAAENVIEQYLGFSLKEKKYKHTVTGAGSPLIRLQAQDVKELLIEGKPCTTADKNIVRLNSPLKKGAVLHLEYTAGYTPAAMPAIIKLTIMRIAALMRSEEGENISITGKSFGSDGGRTFIATRDYSKFLKEIDAFRIL